MREIEENVVPSPPRTWAPVRAGIALLSAALLALAYWNVGNLAVLHDHRLPASIFWPAFWVFLAVAVTMVIPSDLRSGSAIAWAFGGTGLVVFLTGCFVYAASNFGGQRGESVDFLSSPDGRYRVEVFSWQAMLGEPGWDVVIQDRLRGTETYAGCLFDEGSAAYNRIQSIEAGSVRIVTEEDVISIVFDPTTMQVTQRIPVELCSGYG